MRRWFEALLALMLVGLMFAGPARAVLPSEQLADPVLEARARAISQRLRCVVCQNQAIDDSDAPLAHDLRLIVRERLVAGATDEQAIQYLVDRYGSYVLLKPPFEAATLLLWLGPALFVLIGGIGVWVYVARHGRTSGAEAAALSDEDAARVEALLRGTGD